MKPGSVILKPFHESCKEKLEAFQQLKNLISYTNRMDVDE